MRIGDTVMLPVGAPYPLYGRVARREDGDVLVSGVHCDDPRCAAEHKHQDQVWHLDDLLAARTYQPRAGWEAGRKSSPNALVDSA